MRKFAIVYSVLAIWTFGWLTGTFGFRPSLFAAIILCAPAFFTWRIAVLKRETKPREYGYVIVITVLATVATFLIVNNWFETGMDRLAMFDREYHSFRRHISSRPQYKNIEVSYTHRKGGRVYLHGKVANKISHEQLIQTIEWMVRNNESGYYDGVEYPGKPDKAQPQTGRSKRMNQLSICVTQILHNFDWAPSSRNSLAQHLSR